MRERLPAIGDVMQWPGRKDCCLISKLIDLGILRIDMSVLELTWEII